MPQIEVDEQVLAYLRTRVKDFNEDHNTVIRRELGLAKQFCDSAADRSRAAFETVQHVAATGSKALKQILRVIWHVRGEGLDRVTATLRVAEQFAVTRETVADKYGRQLGLTTDEFDALLKEKSLSQLHSRLVKRFPDEADSIGSVISAFALSPVRK